MHRSLRHVVVVAVAASSLLAATAGAQSAPGPRWQAWLGCWTATQPGTSQSAPLPSSAPTVCVAPTADANVVEVIAIADGKVVTRDRIDASGRETAINAKNCTGVQKAEFSADERRVYLKAAANCEGMKNATSAILAITGQGDWIDVRNVVTFGDGNVRVARYHDAGVPSFVPADIAAALNGRSMVSQSARVAAGAPVGTNAVIEASHKADSAVVSAWLLERGQQFALSANDLISLADAGIPAAVTDAMVAVSNPNAFAVSRGDVESEDYAPNRRRYATMDPYYDPYGYGYSRYGYGYNNYGGLYNGGYNGGYYGGYYGRPIVIVTPGTATAGRGQMVKGQGYTQNQPSPTSERTGNERASQPSTSSGSTSASPSGSTTSAPAAQPSTQRTAHPKP